MVTFRNNNNTRRNNFRRNDRNFKSNGDRSKFGSNYSNNENFKRKAPGRNNHNASKLIEKYSDLAREASSNGDKILSENYLQHADHFTRILNEQENYKKIKFAENKSAHKVKQLFHFGLGPVWFNNFGVTKAGYFLQAGRDFELAHGNAYLDCNLALHEKTVGTFGGHIGLNSYWKISPSTSVLAGGKGGISYIHSKIHKKSLSFSMGAQAGIRFFPKSDIHVDLKAQYLAYVNTTGYSTPSLLTFTLSLTSPWK